MRLQAVDVKTQVKQSQGYWHNSTLQDETFSDRKQLCYNDVAALMQDVAMRPPRGS